MSRSMFVMLVFAALILALAYTITAGIWTGDVRWLHTAWIPGTLAFLNFCFMPLILMLVGED